MNLNLSEFSSEVEGFDSTWNNKELINVKDSSTGTENEQTETSEKSSSTECQASVGIQATPMQMVVTSNSNEETDKKLAEWLKKILPAVEKELVEGLTPVNERSSTEDEKSFNIALHQEISVAHLFPNSKTEIIAGSATWLSVSTQDSSVLVLSCYDRELSSFIAVYEPRRSKTEAKIYWHELSTIPVKKPIEFLATNQHNRDMFAGASRSGDIYIWSYSSNDKQVSEWFSKVLEDSIVGLCFLSDNRLLCCQSDGKITVFKANNKQSTSVTKLMKIEPRNVQDPEISCITALADRENDFVLGLVNGSLLHCSTYQLMPQDGSFNPIVRELQAHKFAVSSLKCCQFKRKSTFVVSCDLSGEVFFNEIDDSSKQPKIVIKLPLPLKSKITCRNNMEHILSLHKGSLEVFKTKEKELERIDEEEVEGTACSAVIELSMNESWLVTGVHSGSFKLHHLINN